MNQKHLDLAKQFNAFAFELVSKEATAKKNLESLENDILFRRVIFNKYYYALYHKYLANDDDLSKKTGSSKHDAIKQKIESCGDAKLLQVYSKLLNLRIWADYHTDNNPMALSIGLQEINADVWSIIKRSSINC